MAGSLPKILVVDDEHSVLEGLKRTLRKEADLWFASSAASALEVAKDSEFAVVLTDLTMPGATGYDLIKALMTVSPATMCVVLTGELGTTFPHGLPDNVYTCLKKPCDKTRLVDALNGAISEHILRRHRYGLQMEPVKSTQPRA